MLSRRDFAGVLGAGALGGLAAHAAGGKFRVYVGTYTRGDSKGIYTYILDTAAGTLKPELAWAKARIAIEQSRPRAARQAVSLLGQKALEQKLAAL